MARGGWPAAGQDTIAAGAWLFLCLGACAGPGPKVTAAPILIDDAVVEREENGCLDLGTWRRLRSPHFVLDSDLPPGDAERTLAELDRYFAALIGVFFTAVMPGPEPIPVIALARKDESVRYLAQRFDGVFIDSLLYQPLIVLGASEHGFDDTVVRHELAHYVMRLAYHRDLPKWFAEGLAAYLETLMYDTGTRRLVVGRAGLGATKTLRAQGLIGPATDVIAGRFDDVVNVEGERYYATAWLLVHALIHAAPETFDGYQRALLSGEPAAEAWTRAAAPAFRRDLDAWLRRYLTDRGYEHARRMTWEAPTMAPIASPLNEGELMAVRAILHATAARQQRPRETYHNRRARDLAVAAFRKSPADPNALLAVLATDQWPTPAEIRWVQQRREGSWIPWLVLAESLADVEEHPQRYPTESQRKRADVDAERLAALATAVRIAPEEPRVLMTLGYDDLDHQRWDQAATHLSRGLVVAPDWDPMAYGYAVAVSHDGRCGAPAADALRRAATDSNAGGTTKAATDWVALARALKQCAQAAPVAGAPR